MLNPQLDRSTGSKSHFFQPPHTPTAAYGSGASSRFGYASPTISSSRKRARPSSSHDDAKLSAPYSAQNREWSHVSADSSVARSVGACSPPLINTRYTLAGGLDTPTLKAANLDERDPLAMGINYSRKWDIINDDQSDLRTDYFAPPPPLARESNGRPRIITSNDTQPGWGRFMLTVVGGVAGRMWNFCTTSAFRGFYAGGGKGYDVSSLSISTPNTFQNGQVYPQEESRQLERESTPIPGQYPVEDAEDTPIVHDNDSRRPLKRQHTDTGSGWVMVPHRTQLEDASPRPSRPSLSRSSPSIRSTASRPNVVRATSRKSLLPVSRRSSYISSGGSPAVQTPKRHSLGPARPSSSHESPLSPEAQRYAERVAREDREADRSMRKLNAQLKAMIKQGKEALGTKFEVEVEDEQMEDEGYSESF